MWFEIARLLQCYIINRGTVKIIQRTQKQHLEQLTELSFISSVKIIALI